MIPVEAGRLVPRDAKAVLKRRIARQDRCLEHIVLMAHGRHGGTVEVNIGRDRGHGPAGARIRRGPVHRHVHRWGGGRRDCMRRRARYRDRAADGGAEVDQPVCETQDEQIAGMQSQRRRLSAVGEQITVADRAILLLEVVDGEVKLQDAVAAAQVLRLLHDAAGRRARAPITGIRAGDGATGQAERHCKQA